MKRSALTPLAILALGAGTPPTAAQEAGMQDVMNLPRPIEALDNVWIEELTMMEVRDALAEGKTTALVLTGGIEENGPYLTTGKHNHVLRVMGESIARRLDDALIAPIVTLEPGDPANRRTPPGTILLSRATYEAVLTDMATSLRAQGFRTILFLGDSGGNQRSMAVVADALSEEWGRSTAVHHIPEYYNYDDVLAFQRDVLGVDEDPRLEGLHDDYYITSIIMNEDPRHVRLEQRTRAGLASINGISILPAEETIEHGRRLIEFRTDATVRAIREAVSGR